MTSHYWKVENWIYFFEKNFGRNRAFGGTRKELAVIQEPQWNHCNILHSQYCLRKALGLFPHEGNLRKLHKLGLTFCCKRMMQSTFTILMHVWKPQTS